MSYKTNGLKIRKVTDRYTGTYLYFQHSQDKNRKITPVGRKLNQSRYKYLEMINTPTAKDKIKIIITKFISNYNYQNKSLKN